MSGASCRACSAPIEAGAAKCDRCGAPQRDDVKCPHCGAVSGESPNPELRYACDVCGGPRIPNLDTKSKRSDRELPALRQAEDMRKARSRARGLAVGLGVLGVPPALLAIILFLFGAYVSGVLALLFAGGMFGLSFWSAQRAKQRSAAMMPLVDAAWQAAAADIAENARGSFTSTDLAAKMGISEQQADELLAYLEISDVVRSGASGSYTPRMRVASSLDGGQDREVAAELEALEQELAGTSRASRDER